MVKKSITSQILVDKVSCTPDYFNYDTRDFIGGHYCQFELDGKKIGEFGGHFSAKNADIVYDYGINVVTKFNIPRKCILKIGKDIPNPLGEEYAPFKKKDKLIC